MPRKKQRKPEPTEEPTDRTDTGYEFPLTKSREEVLADFRKIAEPDTPDEDESEDESDD